MERPLTFIKKHINEFVQEYENFFQLLCMIPGVDKKSSITIISEIGTDMLQWSPHHKLVLWAGLAPGCNESTGKKKSVKISGDGVYLKPCLVQVAHAAVKNLECHYYANKFNQISKRRGKKRAIIAIARKFLVAIYHIIKTGEIFNPNALADKKASQKKRIEYIKNNFKNVYNQLIHTKLTEEQILAFLPKKSPNTPLIEWYLFMGEKGGTMPEIR